MDIKSMEWIMGMIIAAVTAILTAFHKKLTTTNQRIDQVREDYVRRDDFANYQKSIKKRFDKINEKLDRLIARK